MGKFQISWDTPLNQKATLIHLTLSTAAVINKSNDFFNKFHRILEITDIKRGKIKKKKMSGYYISTLRLF